MALHGLYTPAFPGFYKQGLGQLRCTNNRPFLTLVPCDWGLQVWLAHTQDPVIQPDAQEVIDALASHANCVPSLVAAAAPTLAAILRRGAAVRLARQQGQSPEAAAAAGAAAVGSAAVPEETSMLVEATLDLLRALVKPRQDATTMEVGEALRCGRCR